MQTYPALTAFVFALGSASYFLPEPAAGGTRPAKVASSTTTNAQTQDEPYIFSAIDRPWNRAVERDSRRILDLKRGWDGPGASPIMCDTLFQATHLLTQALEGYSNSQPPFIVPRGDGSVQLEWHRKHAELELTVTASGRLHLWGQDLHTGAEFEGEDGNALDLFFRWAPRVAAPVVDVGNVSSETTPPILQIAA